MNARGDPRYPNPNGIMEPYHATDYPDVHVGYPGYLSSSYPRQDQYSYGSNAEPSTGHNFTDVRNPYNVAGESYIGPSRAIRQSDPYQPPQYAGCPPGQNCAHLSRHSSSTQWIHPTNTSYTGVGYGYGRESPNVTVGNYCPQRTGSNTLLFPPHLVSSWKTPTGCQQVLQSSARPLPASQYVASPLKRLAEYCDPNEIPLKRQCMDQNAIPYSVQLNSYRKGLHIQESCFLTVIEDTNNPQDSYSAAPSVKFDTLKERYPGTHETNIKLSGKQTDLPVSTSMDKNSKTLNEVTETRKLTPSGAMRLANKILQLALKYMPHFQPKIAKMSTSRYVFLTNEACSQLMHLIRNRMERYVLAVYMKYKSEIYHIINNSRCTFNQKENHLGSSSEETTPKAYVQQNRRNPPSKIDNANSDRVSSRIVPNSDKAICELHNQTVPRHSRDTISPAYSPCSPSSFSSASNGFARNVGNPPSSNTPCTFLSESEFREQPCGSVNRNLPIIENMAPPPAAENILPHPPVSYSRDPLNYDKLHVNPISENYSNQTQDAYSCLQNNNPRLLEILKRQPETASKLSWKAIASQCAMGDVNFKQNAASLMKLPEVVSPQSSRKGFSPKPNTSSIITNLLQSPALSVSPTKLPTVDSYKATSTSEVSNDNGPLIPPPKTIKPPQQSPVQKHFTDVSIAKYSALYTPSTSCVSKFHEDDSHLISKRKGINSDKESFVQKPDTGVFPSKLSTAETAKVKVFKHNLNPITENYSYHTQDDHSSLANSNPRLLEILTSQTKTPSKLSCNAIASQCAMGVVNFKQNAASMMKLPEAVSPQQSINSFSSKPDISSNSMNLDQSPALTVYPTQSPTEATSRSKVTNNGSPLILAKESSVWLPTLYPPPSRKFLNHNFPVNSKHKAVESDEKSFVQTPNNFIFKVSTVEASKAKVIKYDCTVNPKPNAITSQEKSFVQKPENISPKSNDFTESENDDINWFNVEPQTEDPMGASQGSRAIGMNSSSVKSKSDNYAVSINQSQNTSGGQPGKSLSVKAECVTIYDSDDETDVIILDDEVEESTATETSSKISSDNIVGGTTFATFTIVHDEIEMTTQEFGIEMLDMFMKSE